VKSEPSSRRNALIATAVALPVTVLIAFILANGHGSGGSSPSSSASGSAAALPAITVTAPVPTAEVDAACSKLLAGVPATLDGLARRPVISSSPYIWAWGDPAVTMRCGVERPAGVSAQSTDVWVSSGTGQTATSLVTWDPVNTKDTNNFTTVDRAVYIELDVPAKAYRQPPLAPISDWINSALPQVCVPSASAPRAQNCGYRP
jgi:hypothetical protein